MGGRDPFDILQLDADATPAEVHAARRRLAKRLHPDRGGDGRRMQELNAAVVDALAQLAVATDAKEPPSPASSGQTAPVDHVRRSRRGPRAIVEDVPSFVVEALPVEAFQLIEAVAPTLGEVLEDDPPYVLDIALSDPPSSWCRVELLPEAGASTVNLYVGAFGVGDPPSVEDVRDTWIAALNAADWPEVP